SLYRTGDLARLLPNGDLEYLGRLDHQVKIRGFRIEIAEIQVAISQYPGVQDNIIVVRDDDNEKRLIAYIVCAPGTEPTVEALRTHLQQHLNDYMVPSQFIYLEKFPLTSNGKIDRQALPIPEISRAHLEVAFVPPANVEEEILAQIWQKVLKVDKVGRFDNYFVLGGDSIRSIRVCSLAEEAGLVVKLEQIFYHPVLSELADAIRAQKEQTTQQAIHTKPFILLGEEDRQKIQDWAMDAYPLAQLQAGMLFESDYSEGVTAYNDLFSFRVRIPFHLEVWEQAYAQMFARHRILRTAFYIGEFSQPLQVIRKQTPEAKIIFEDLTSVSAPEQEAYLQSFSQKERTNGFDWLTAPLLRFYLHQLDAQTVQITFAVHHAILDGWSLSLFITELTNLYFYLLDKRVPLPPPSPTLQYSRFVALEQEALASENQREFWKGQLLGIPFTQLPRYPGALKQRVPGRMAKIDIILPKEIAQGLKNLSQRLGIPIKTVLLAIHMRLLAFCAGEQEVVTGLVCNGRPTEPDGDRILGLFLNTLPFRLQLTRGSWIDLIQATFHAEQALTPYRRFPVAEIQRLHAHQPLYETVFNFVHFHVYQGILELRDVELIKTQSFDETNIPFSVSWSQEILSDDLFLNITYNSNEFHQEQMAAYADYCTQMCAAVATHPEGYVSEAEIILQQQMQEHHQSMVSALIGTECVHEIFERLASQHPESIAVVYENEIWTSSQLNQKANQLARWLRNQGITLDKPVGICLERSVEMVYAILAVLKAGGCYVPIDPHYPTSRIHSMIQDSKTTLVLTQDNLESQLLVNGETQIVLLNHLTEEIAAQSSENLKVPVLEANIAYIIFTSGSTGRAKGIAISHQSLAHHMAWFIDAFAITRSDVFLQKTPFSFDGSVWEFWAALMTSAKLVMAKPGGHQDTDYLMHIIQQEKVTIFQVVPTLLEVLLGEQGFGECSSLRLVLCGGEALRKRVLDKFYTTLAIPLVNIYGPAEATLNASFHRCQDNEKIDTVPIGKPLPNTHLYILDRDWRPVPLGTPGELYIAGPQLARGYWYASRLTADRFLPNPFAQEPGDRMYRTGDNVRLLPNGNLEFLGRIDHQIKIRGFRVETGEIVTVLENQPYVTRAITKAFSTANQPNRLVAYVEMKDPPEYWQELLRFSVRNALPDYMVPSLFVRVDIFPLLPNGKINLNALTEPEEEDIAVTSRYVAPRNETETLLTKIWQDVLKVSHIGIEHDFFELGGDSIICLQIIAKARAHGIHFSPADVFRYSSISKLTPHIKSRGGLDSANIFVEEGDIPLTPIQQWFFEQSLAHPEQWNQGILLDLQQEMAPDNLKTTLEQIAASQEAFRLRFRKNTEGWKQYLVRDSQSIAFETVDVSTIATKELSEQISAIATQFHAQLDLEHGPLARAVYFQTNKDTPNKLLLIIHHLIVDGVSWRVILQNLIIPSTPLYKPGFAQWAVQLHQQIQTSQWDSDLEFWKAQYVANPALPLDFPLCLERNLESSAVQIECNFSKSETESLLYELPRTRNSRIQETLLALLLEVVTDWIGSQEMAIALESHGRDNDFTNIDILESVGWFTSLFPLRLERKTDDILSNLESVKEQLRKLPHNGFSYGILSRKPEFADSLPKIPSSIIFNYLGQFDVHEVSQRENFPPTSPFTPSLENAGVAQHPDNQRSFQLEIVGLILNGQLQIRFVYSQALHQESTIRQLANNFYHRFTNLLTQSRIAPTDFPLASVNQEQLAQVLAGTTDVEDIYPLAPVQEGMLFHANYDSQNGAYLQQVTAEITGNLDVIRFQQAWEHCIQRHPSLRASFIMRDLPRPLQRIHRHIDLPFVYQDWSDLSTDKVASKWQKFLNAESQQSFALEVPPLMRLSLVKTEEQKWKFVWTHHHLLLDGWSLPLVFGDAIAYYKANNFSNIKHPAPVYRNFIHWLNTQDFAQAESFWRRELQGMGETTSLGLKFEKDSEYQVLQSAICEETYTRLVEFAQKNKVTLNTVVQAAWSLLLSRYSRSEDIVFGVTVSGRPLELPNSAEIVGLFINTLPLRVTLNPGSTVKSWLQELRDRTQAINQYSYSRLVDIQGWSDIPRGQPLFESIIVYENYPVEESLRKNSGDLKVHSVQSTEKTHYPVTLYALPAGKELLLKIGFQENVGHDQQRQQLLHQFVQILEGFANDEPEFLGDIGLLSKMEERNFLQQNFFKPQDIDTTATVHQIFSQQATLTPDAPAVKAQGCIPLTYGELDRRSNQLAHTLRQMGVEQETLVGVCLERHPGLLVALLGILKAGAAYVPLDPAFPQERLDFMLTDSGVNVIVADNKTISQINHPSGQILLMDSGGAIASSQPETPLPPLPHNQSLAYVIYTSGSTGKPKGVQITHQALINFLLSFREEPGLSPLDTLVAVTTLSFDISLLELFLPLISGAQLVVADRETVRDGFKLAQLLNQSQATVMQATPATWRLLLTAGWKPHGSFRALCGGETMPSDLGISLLDIGVELWNVYGPTETTIWSTLKSIKKPEDIQSIGQGIANTSVYILDNAGHPVPAGVIGNLFIAGTGLARGYRAQSQLTALKFIPNPFSQNPGERLYDTGDLARFLPNGEIEFLGRSDFQVKIRGFRIELGDIETVLENYSAIAQAIVQPFEETPSDKKLIAYLVVKADIEKPDPETLRAYVLEKLPDYMVPSVWVFLDALPLTPNNKVDRRALKAPNQLYTQADYIAPRNPIEEALVEIWQELIKVEKVGIKDNFFDLGGHSLIAAQVHARIRKVFSIDLSLRELFDYPTIEKTTQLLIEKEPQSGRTEKIARAFLRMKRMSPEQKAKFLEEKRKGK
ncbi:MAG: amino acid adenylation domain-containing protein, partial [Scytonema sp. PMC 1070.18]|nr:amino acid adenylation domain-containing protein [Scytonema sp. PMC 1070.18]